jgi:hypothetical protein
MSAFLLSLFFKHNHQPCQVWNYIQSNTKRQTNNNTDTQKKVKILHSFQTGLLKSPKKETGLIQSNMRVTQTSPTAPRSSCPVTRMGIKRAKSSRHSNLTFPSYRLSSLHSQDHKSLLLKIQTILIKGDPTTGQKWHNRKLSNVLSLKQD